MAADDDDIPAAALVLALERLSHLLRSQEHDSGLNPAQWAALRFLAQANRHSNSPGALTRYLGATKGTISQTLIALERKGLVRKETRAGERRSVALALTEAGQAMLAQDPWSRLAATIEGLGGKTRRRFGRGLGELLASELARGRHPSFGSCPSCRFFREKGAGNMPHCMLFGESLTPAETERICAEHEPRA